MDYGAGRSAPDDSVKGNVDLVDCRPSISGWKWTTILVLCGGFLLALAVQPGCQPPGGNASSGGGTVAGNSATANVTYQSSVQVLEEDAGNAAIAGISTNGAALLLDASNPQVAALQAGSVLVIKGLLAKKVIAVEPHDPYLLVLTQPADLLDAISDGHVSLSTSVQFGDLPAAKVRQTSQSPEGVGASQAEAAGTKDALGNILNGIKGAIVDGWTVDWSATPSAGQVTLSVKLTKSAGGIRAVVTGDGYLQGFDCDGDILVQQSTYQQIQANLKSINGLMNFTWEVATDTPGQHTDKARVKLPGAIEVPLAPLLDGLPLFLEISAAVIIEPALTGGQEFSRGSFRITYDGAQQFTAKEGNIDSNGNVTGDIQFLEGQNISALAPLGMVVSFAAPRIELTFGVSKALKTSGDIKEAAETVDKLADVLAQKVLTADQYQQFKNSPMGQFSLAQAAEISLASDATASFEMVTSCGMSNTGMSVVAPCTRHDIDLWGKVGASAQAFGQNLGNATKDIFHTQITNIDPPDSTLCAQPAGG